MSFNHLQLPFVVSVFYWLSSANKNFVTSFIYHILHFILAANLVDNSRTLTIKLLSRNPTFYFQNEQFGNLVLRKIIKCCHHMSDFKAKIHQIQIQNIAILDLSKAISLKRCKIGGKLQLTTNRKSHMSF